MPKSKFVDLYLYLIFSMVEITYLIKVQIGYPRNFHLKYSKTLLGCHPPNQIENGVCCLWDTPYGKQ